MRIIAFVNQNSGPSYHRLMVPLLLMKNVDVFITNNLEEKHFEKGCDLFMYNRILPGHSISKINELKLKYGFSICVDVDDHWQLDEHHLLYDEYKDLDFAKKQTDQLRAADIVLTTHSRLADEIKPFNLNVHVCPNAIPTENILTDSFTKQFAVQRESYKFTRLFWQGSITHREDIAVLKTAINALGFLSPKIKMVMAGFMDGEPEWDVMARDYTANLKHQYQILKGCHVSEYYKNYANADVCLIPLLNSHFNRHKSNLKVLEAAHLSLPCIVSKVNPYLDLPVFYASNSTDWVNHIKRLVASKKRQREAGQELKEFVDIHYNFEKINEHRRQVLTYNHVTV